MKTANIQKTRTQIMNTRTLISIAMLSTISYLLAFIEISIPLSPSFAKMDISDLPALIASFAFSPIAGVIVQFIKNSLQLLSTSTAGVGEFANFIMGASFVFVAGLIYHRRKTRGAALIACVLGSITMALVAGFTNYFILFPMFENFMPLEQLIASFSEFIPFINSKFDVMLWNVVPFNLLKGFGLSIITMLLYKPLTPILRGDGK